MGSVCETVDVTLENGFFRSPAKEDCLISKMLKAMHYEPEIPMLTANQIGIDKQMIALRTGRDSAYIIMNPKVIARSGSKFGKHKSIKVKFSDVLGRVQEVKFRGRQSLLLQQGLLYMGIEV